MIKKLKILLSIALTLIAGEITSLVIYKAKPIHSNIYNSYTGWLPRAHTSGWNTESGQFVRKSNLGWNDENLNSQFDPKCSINFFGDSMTEGFQFKSKNTFSATLEQNLSKNNLCQKTLVNNFGLTATGTFQQARIMEIYGEKFPAKRTAVFLFLGNDLANNIYNPSLPYKPGITVLEGQIIVNEANYETSHANLKFLISRLSDYSNLIRMFYYLLEPDIVSQRTGNVNNEYAKSLMDMGVLVVEDRIEDQILAMGKSLEILSRIAQKQQTDLTIFIIPTGAQVTKGDNWLMKEIKYEIDNYCINFQLKCLDLLPKFRQLNSHSNFSKFHIDGIGHLNLKGHSAIARILLNYYNQGS
jgi:hypothetical protein